MGAISKGASEDFSFSGVPYLMGLYWVTASKTQLSDSTVNLRLQLDRKHSWQHAPSGLDFRVGVNHVLGAKLWRETAKHERCGTYWDRSDDQGLGALQVHARVQAQRKKVGESETERVSECCS